ncbi:MAG: hypothetical protein AMK72_02270 [Planctomycetes bacterium SM23_25]|nr:MAG: hypothetical protein AMS14_00785 [Planctomycetes bacterium DG_20]KPK50460.1 MAG: hypothetical protein AMK72_02270 [Planctomycetes bacterium SM23_25]
MRRLLLISLAAVIVAGGLAMAAYGEERRGPPPDRGEGDKRGGERRGPPRIELTPDQQGALENDPEVKEARAALLAAVEKFQKAIAKIIPDERARRMVMFQAIMRTMPPREGGGPRSTERPKRPPE